MFTRNATQPKRPVHAGGLALAALVSLAAAAPAPLAQEAPSLTVVSWGGSYARASVKAYHERFTQETGVTINLEEFNGGLAQVRAQVETGNVTWDVVDLEGMDTLLGCDEGLLQDDCQCLLRLGASLTNQAVLHTMVNIGYIILCSILCSIVIIIPQW